MGHLSNAYSLSLLDLDSITNVDPFVSVTTVGDWLSIIDNALPGDATGLHHVTSVGDVNVTDNPNLSSQTVDDLIEAIGTENISGTITVSGKGP